VAAALAARRCGCDVLLVEGTGQFGGMGTSGLVTHWLGGRTSDGRGWVVGGIFRELSERAAAAGFARLPTADAAAGFTPHGWHRGRGPLVSGVPFDPVPLAALLDAVLTEAGVELLLDTRAVDALTDGAGRITHVVVQHKGGFEAVPAAAVVDATGDADLAARSGCEVILGREGDQLMTPATLEMIVDQVDADALAAYIDEHGAETRCYRFLDEIARWRAAGDWPFTYDRLICVQLPAPDTFLVNTSRLVGVDGTDADSLTAGYVEGRRQSLQLLEVLRRRAPGFAHARIRAQAPLMGIRETRRIRAVGHLTVDDVVNGRAEDDTIGFSAYGWDLPDPKRPSHQPLHEQGVAKPEYTAIPYGIMVPQPVTNLICPGRAVGVERDVLGPLRVMAPCMAMGEAAGEAAAVVAGGTPAFAAVAVDALRERLRAHGAVIDADTLSAATTTTPP
jgi:hypothetical protein